MVDGVSEMSKLDWLECPEIEAVPGRCGGRPTIKGTRIEPEAIIENFEGGSDLAEIHENYPHVPVDRIRRIIEFHHSHQLTF